MKTKALIVGVALGDLAGQVVTFLGGLANKSGWDVVKLPCECAWAVLAFPLGWLGLIAPGLAAAPKVLPYAHLFLWTGVVMNGALWGWMVYRVARSLRRQGTHHGFDASAFSVRLSEVRQSHVAAAHARAGSAHSRKGLGSSQSRCPTM